MAPEKLHEVYAQQMRKRHDYGFPLYEPASRTVIKPGTCGYIDTHGQWNPVADLSKSADLIQRGLSVPTLHAAPDDHGIRWGPKSSDSVKGRRLNVEVGAGAAATGIPVEAAVVYQYSSSTDFGAVLMTESPVWREALYYDQPFRDWVAANALTLLKLRPEIQEHGLWVVRWIYSTKKCALNAWTDKSKSITVGFKAKVVGAGELGPDAEWYESSHDSGWIHAQADEGDRKVVFFGGLHFRYSKLSRSRLKDTSSSHKWTFRGADDRTENIFVDGDDDESYAISCTSAGKLDLQKEDDNSDIEF